MTMANADLRLPLNKRESINLRVFIHCDACTKSVKKVLNRIDGVESVVVDAELGKVTVLGTVDSKTLIKKLKKAGKRAEPWSGAMAMHHHNNNTTTTTTTAAAANNINNNNHNNHNHKEKLLKESKDKKAMSDLLESFNNNSISFTGGHANRNANAIVGGLPSKAFNGSSAVNVNAMVASRPEAGPQYFNAKTVAAAVGNTAPILRFTTESAPPDYPTYIFSDENAHNCSIM